MKNLSGSDDLARTYLVTIFHQSKRKIIEIHADYMFFMRY